MEKTIAAIKDIVSLTFNTPTTELSDDTRFVEDLNADSLDKVEMIMLIEDAFNIEVDDADSEDIQTIADLDGFIMDALNNKT